MFIFRLMVWLAHGFFLVIGLFMLFLAWQAWGWKFVAVMVLVLAVNAMLEYKWPSEKRKGG